MSRRPKHKNGKVRKMTEEEYEAYVMSLKEQTPPLAYRKYAKEEIEPSGGEKKGVQKAVKEAKKNKKRLKN